MQSKKMEVGERSGGKNDRRLMRRKRGVWLKLQALGTAYEKGSRGQWNNNNNKNYRRSKGRKGEGNALSLRTKRVNVESVGEEEEEEAVELKQEKTQLKGGRKQKTHENCFMLIHAYTQGKKRKSRKKEMYSVCIYVWASAFTCLQVKEDVN